MSVVSVDTKEGLFAGVEEFPDSDVKERFDSLLGVDDLKEAVVQQAEVTLNPEGLRSWARRYKLEGTGLMETFARRPHLIIFAGDVGTGKSALAETFGDAAARRMGLPVTLYRLSLSTRGSGAVGEMTQLLAAAFSEVHTVGVRMRGTRRSGGHGGIVFVIDEADALAQSRELVQMHHEDRAGVNELIRGIDDLGRDKVPVLVVMCTNRLEALDPAIRRRAAETFTFARPGDEQRRILLSALFTDVLSKSDIDRLVEATGPTAGRVYGFTFSDIAQRLVSSVVLDAYPSSAVSAARVLTIAGQVVPTAPFATELS
jgi:AAA+ superfamily predicted ATPase